MLSITRKPGEAIEVDNGYHKIVVVIEKVRGDRVQVAIKADQEFRIRRNDNPTGLYSSSCITQSEATENGAPF